MPIKENNIEEADNTRVYIQPYIQPFKLSFEQIVSNALRKRKWDIIYDKNIADYYRNLQNFYNMNAFGFGISGDQTNFDYTIPEGQAMIQSSFDYGRNNVQNFGLQLVAGLEGGIARGILPHVSRRVTVGKINDFIPYKIGEGAETVVINNSPTTVGKITTVPRGEMLSRNLIPQSEPVKFVGYTRQGEYRLPTFIQRKLKVLNEETFPRYIQKLDNIMEKHGFRIIDDPYVQYRAYTNGNIVIDDIAPGNVGIMWNGKPKLIDFNIQSVDSWFKQGFGLKDGGKIMRRFKRHINLKQFNKYGIC